MKIQEAWEVIAILSVVLVDKREKDQNLVVIA